MSEHEATTTGPDSRGCTDEELAEALQEAAKRGEEILAVVNGYSAALYSRAGSTCKWQCVAMGDFDQECLGASRPLVRRKKLLWATTAQQPSHVDVDVLSVEPASAEGIKTWLKAANGLAFGRTGEVSAKTMQDVAMAGSWRCQFSGCGKDLRKHFATGRAGTYSYFAHIVAASPKGPRGNLQDSQRLCDDPTNIMLTCDECHRLIDRVDPDYFTVSMLREMRERSIHEVERLLDTLRYPEVEPIMLVGNIGGQVAHFSMRDAEEALWQVGLRTARGKPEFFFLNGNHLHDPHAPHYWGSLFGVLKTDIPRLQAFLNGSQAGGRARPPLAVFPKHGTSVVILGGRMVGDTAGVHLFQFHRNQACQWAWPKDAVEPAADKYAVRTLRNHSGEKEACLLLSLTFPITRDRLPEDCADAAGLKLPTLEIAVEQFGHDAVSHRKDLELLGKAIDEALRRIQDEWKVRRVHLFVGAPLTACFRMGQKMQARHQATFVCHEAGLDRGPFKPTIEISSDSVLEPISGSSITLAP